MTALSAPRAGSSAPAGRALFVRLGKFSGTNARLLEGMRRVRPDLVFDELDLGPALNRGVFALAASALGALREYGPGILSSRARLRYALSRNGAYDGLARRRIAARLNAGAYLFSLQTQSIFNGAVGGAPNLVYTDHVARARGRAGWDDGRGEPSSAWLAREAAIYRDARHVFTFGSGVRRMLIEEYGVPPERITRAGAGPNVLPARPPDLSLGRYARRNILFVGVDWERKGGPDLLAAFRLLRERLPDATLTIAGCAPPEAAGQEGVEALGRLPPAEIDRLFRAASCFCMPTRLEPFGIVFVEALHFGVPAVGTTVGDVGDIVREGETGWRVPPGDPAALAEALHRILADPAVAQRMGAAAVALAPEFTWEAVAARILAQAPPPSAGVGRGADARAVA